MAGETSLGGSPRPVADDHADELFGSRLDHRAPPAWLSAVLASRPPITATVRPRSQPAIAAVLDVVLLDWDDWPDHRLTHHLDLDALASRGEGVLWPSIVASSTSHPAAAHV